MMCINMGQGKGSVKKVEPDSVLLIGSTRCSGHKLKYNKFHLNKKNFFHWESGRALARVPRNILKSPSLEILRTWLDTVLGNCLEVTLLGQCVWNKWYAEVSSYLICSFWFCTLRTESSNDSLTISRFTLELLIVSKTCNHHIIPQCIPLGMTIASNDRNKFRFSSVNLLLILPPLSCRCFMLFVAQQLLPILPSCVKFLNAKCSGCSILCCYLGMSWPHLVRLSLLHPKQMLLYVVLSSWMALLLRSWKFEYPSIFQCFQLFLLYHTEQHLRPGASK